MRVETALVLPACSAEVAAPDPHGASPCWQPESADRGGGFGLPGRAEAADGGRGLAWRLYSQRPDVLDLTELSLGEPLRGASLRVTFPAAVFPFLGHAPGEGGTTTLFLLAATGSLFQLSIPARERTARGDSALAAVAAAPGAHISCQRLALELEPLGQPTCLLAAAGSLVLGGASGAVLAFPMRWDAGAGGHVVGAERPAELQPSAWSLQRLLPSLFGKPTMAPVAALAAAPGATPAPALLALHANGMLSGWDVGRRAQLLLAPFVAPAEGGQPRLRPGMRPTALALSAAPGGALHAVAAFADDAGRGAAWAARLAVGEGGLAVAGEATKLGGLDGRVLDLVPLGGAAFAALLQAGGAVHYLELDAATGVAPGGGAAQEGRLLEEDMREWLPDADNPTDLELLAQLGREVAARAGAEPGGEPLDIDAHFTSLMLSPHALSRPALHETLAYYRFPSSLASILTSSQEQLAATLASCVDAAAAALPRFGRLGAWRSLLATYWAAWKSAEAPVGLLRWGALPGVVRGRAGLGLLRAATPLELLFTPGLSEGALDAELAAWGGALPPNLPEMRVLAGCAIELRSCLGALTGSLALTLSRRGADVMGTLLPSLLALLAGGPPAASLPSDAERRANAAWRRSRGAVTLRTAGLLASLPSLGATAGAAAALAAWAPPPAGAGSAASGAASPPVTLLPALAHQLATRQVAAARDMLLLLGFAGLQARQGGGLAAAALGDTGGLAELQSRWHAQLLAGCLGLVLAGSPAAAPPRGRLPADPFAALKDLTLGGPAPVADAATDASPGAAADSCAAALLLPDFLACPTSRAGRGAEPGRALSSGGLSFLAFLAAGGREGKAPGSEPEVVAAVLAAAMAMFSGRPRQLRLMRELVALGGAAADSPTALFLAGLCAQLAGGARDDGPGDAVRLLLRAGQGVESDAALAAALVDLRSELTGARLQDGEEMAVEVSAVEYYETMMLFFEQQSCPAGAAQCARAAIRACQEGSGDSVQLGQLWSSLLTYTVEAGAWSEAYAVLLANPDPARFMECLHHMLRHLIAARQIHTLCSLPWAGVRELEAGGPPAPLAGEVLRYLRRWADESDLAEPLRPYAILYDLAVCRGEYRLAAEAQLCLARRTVLERQSGGVGAMRDAAAAILAALDALSLVDASWAWLEEPLSGYGSLVSAQLPMLWGSQSVTDAPEPAAGARLATAASLQQEYALLRARLAIAEALPASSAAHVHTVLPWRDVFHNLLSLSMVDEAITLALAWEGGAEAAALLEEAVRALADACVRLQAASELELPADSLALPPRHSERATQQAPPPANSDPAKAWAQLRHHLSALPPGGAHGHRLAAAAADAILGAKHSMQLPQWLVAMFEGPPGGAQMGKPGSGTDPAALLRIYLKFDRLEEAAELVVTEARAWREVPFTEREHQRGHFFAYNMIDILHSRLAEAGQQERAEQLLAAVRGNLELAKSDAAVAMT
eukprot:jgi/Tetstr1/466101/TSEL_000929.t1